MNAYSPLELALAFIRTGEITDALDALNTALTADPTHQEARRLRAEVHARGTDEMRWRSALADYAALDALTITDALRVAALWQRVGDDAAALAALDAARAQYPADERLAEGQATLYMARGQYAEALALIAQRPVTWRWLALAADCDTARGEHTAAVESLTRALALLDALPDHDTPFFAEQRARLLSARGRAHRALARYTDALDDYTAAYQAMPNDPLILFNQAVVMHLSQQQGAAVYCHTAYQAANAALRDIMRAEIKSDPRLHGLLTLGEA